MAALVVREIEGGIATLTMNRPEKRNALSPQLIEAMLEAIAAVEAAESVRVMILAGAGRGFCAGMDLRGVLDEPVAVAGLLRGLSLVLRRIRRLRVPTIAAVHGAAIGGGCGLMVVTDFAITHPEARVGYPEVSLGVCPAVVAPWLMRKVGPGRARALLLEGGTMSGREALAAGLADRLVEEGGLAAAARTLAESLASGGAHALAVTKRWVNELDGSLEDGPLDRGAALSAEVIATGEARKRLRQALERQ